MQPIYSLRFLITVHKVLSQSVNLLGTNSSPLLQVCMIEE